MATTVIIAKNVVGSNIIIEDLGIRFPSGAQINLTELFEQTEINNSDDLKLKVNLGHIILNDGISDLNITNGLKHINFETEYEDTTSDIISGGHTLDFHTDVPTPYVNSKI